MFHRMNIYLQTKIMESMAMEGAGGQLRNIREEGGNTDHPLLDRMLKFMHSKTRKIVPNHQNFLASMDKETGILSIEWPSESMFISLKMQSLGGSIYVL